MQRLEKVKDGKGEGKWNRKGGTPEKPGSKKKVKALVPETADASAPTGKSRKRKVIKAPPAASPVEPERGGKNTESGSAIQTDMPTIQIIPDFDAGKFSNTTVLLMAAKKVICIWEMISYQLANGQIKVAGELIPHYTVKQQAFNSQLENRLEERVIPKSGDSTREGVLRLLIDAGCSGYCWTENFIRFITSNATTEEILNHLETHPGWAIEKSDDGIIVNAYHVTYMLWALVDKNEKTRKMEETQKAMISLGVSPELVLSAIRNIDFLSPG